MTGRLTVPRIGGRFSSQMLRLRSVVSPGASSPFPLSIASDAPSAGSGSAAATPRPAGGSTEAVPMWADAATAGPAAAAGAAAAAPVAPGTCAAAGGAVLPDACAAAALADGPAIAEAVVAMLGMTAMLLRSEAASALDT